MATKNAGGNPFYVLLVIVGIAFTLTACAYGVMAIKAIHPSETPRQDTPAGKALLAFLDRHGASTMAGELVLLALCTFGAIGTDQYWTRRNAPEAVDDERTAAGLDA